MLLYLKITYLNNFKQLFFFCKTTEAFVEFHLKYDKTPGFQNYKLGLDQESRMATITKNSKTIKINFFSRTTYLPSFKKVNKTAHAPLIFAYNLVIERGEKSGARLKSEIFSSLRHKLLREISNTVLSYPYCLLSTTLNLLSICKSTMPNKYPVPLFVYLQCILTHDSYANKDSERLNQYW